LPDPGDEMDVELSLGDQDVVWDRDVHAVLDGRTGSIEQSPQGFDLVGEGEWDQGDQIIWFRLAIDCLMLVSLDRDPGESRDLGTIAIHTPVLVMFPTGA
jgi:hypothetical protein